MKKCAHLLEFVFIVIVSLNLTSCGGDDDGSGMGTDDEDATETRLPQSIIDQARYTSSYMLDIDQDGDDDIILGPADGIYSTNLLLINDGTGVFEIRANAFPSRYQEISGHTVNITSGDFDNDGRPDIIASTLDARPATFFQSAQIHLYLNNGDGSFSDGTAQINDNLFPDSWIEWIRVGDFNNDGNLDFVTTVAGGDSFDPANDLWSGGLIYLNDGSANFSRTTIRMNDNGVLGEYTHPHLAWDNAARGEITRVPLDIFVGDVDNDGDIDLVAPNGWAGGQWATFLNISVSTEASFEVVLNGIPLGLNEAVFFKNGALMDIDGDGSLDVIGSRAIDGFGPGAPIEILLNDGNGRFPQTTSGLITGAAPGLIHARQWLVGDFNGDSADDLFVADHGLDQFPFPGFPNTLLLSSGGSLSNSSSNVGMASAFTHGAAVGDIDNDGNLDILMNNQQGLEDIGGAATDNLIYLNNGSGVFTGTN